MGAIEDFNIYHCNPCLKTKIFNLEFFHFQFLSRVMAKTKTNETTHIFIAVCCSIKTVPTDEIPAV